MNYSCQSTFAQENEDYSEFCNLQFLSLPIWGRFGGGFKLTKV